MTTRKIIDINLVADASNVRCVMVATKNIKVVPLADHHLKHQRHQIIRDADLIFYNEAKAWKLYQPLGSLNTIQQVFSEPQNLPASKDAGL